MHGPTDITPEDLVRAVEAGEPFQVLDIRAPERLANGKVDVVDEARFFNMAGSKLTALDDPAALGIDPHLPLAVVCARGVTSRQMLGWFAARGFAARSILGGMAGWMLALVERPLTPPEGFDLLLQFDRVGKGALGYLLARGGEALVLDPSRNARPLLDAAATRGLRIVGVADTHVHADYLSSGPGLAQHLGVPYFLHPADAVYPYDGTPGRVRYTPIEEGGEIALADARVAALHTPGHTEGSTTFLAGDAAFTGDFVFIQSIGRPDLAGKTEEWTGALWTSLERLHATWPVERMVYPAHYASAAERRADHAVGASLRDVLPQNEPLGIRDREAFFRWVRERAGTFPDAYRTIKAINLGLLQADADLAEELEGGKNQCALA
jgi:glyoxylase-like metal-dependent hydrolase (beta-lactamase superfamily II)